MQAERLSQSRDARRVKPEYNQGIETVTMLLDGIGKLALAPPVYPGDAPSVVGDSLADGIEGGAQRFFIEVGAQNGNNLVSAQLGTLPSSGLGS
ncbi:MAG TPA: hypothetical protein VNA86_03190, partial [bacterium]|nr:hypothetical protein [bacterium]